VNYLPEHYDDDKLFKVFSQFGEIQNAYVIYDAETGRSRKFGYVITKSSSLASELHNMHKICIEGKSILVRFHEFKRTNQGHSSNSNNSSSYKKSPNQSRSKKFNRKQRKNNSNNSQRKG
jgi:hypothetical protein